MMIQISEARELCSKSEWELVAGSFSPVIETFSRADLKSRLDRAIKLYRKATDLESLQHSESRKRTTRRRTEMFAEAIDRLEATLDLLEHVQNVEPAPKDVHNKKIAEEKRTLNMDALQEHADRGLANLRRRVLSALAVHNEQHGQKSGARHIQSHVGSVNRRQQRRRDTKNR
jgi:hypothetical protein